MEDLFVFTWQVTRNRRVSVARECSSLDKKATQDAQYLRQKRIEARPILNGIEVVSWPEVIEENFSEWDLDF